MNAENRSSGVSVPVVPAQTAISTSNIELYCDAMEEIKFRTAQAYAALKEEIKFARADLKTEFVCLQIRKILELIILSSFVSDKNSYSEVGRAIQKREKIDKILNKLTEINPSFYPAPVKELVKLKKIDRTDNSVWSLKSGISDKKGKKVPLSKEEFLILYKECSRQLHVPNILKVQPQEMFSFGLDVWLSKTVLLLQHHTIKLAGDGELWRIQMNCIEKNVAYTICIPCASGSPPTRG